MKFFIIIVIFVKLYNCAEINYDENEKPQNSEKNWIKPGLLDKIVENIQNSRKLLQLPNRENFIDSKKKRCETCRESIRCKNQGKCELCNRLCKDLDVPSVSPTDLPMVGNVQNNDFAQDAIKDEKSHRYYTIATVDPEHRTDSLKTLLNDLGKNNSNTVIVLAKTKDDMVDIFRETTNKTHVKTHHPNEKSPRFHNKPTLADVKQPLIPELQALPPSTGKNRFENTNSILRSHRKNSGDRLENHTQHSPIPQSTTEQNSNVVANHENKQEFKRADQDRQTSSFKIDLPEDGLSPPKRGENQDESGFTYVKQFSELLKKLEEKVENIADLVKTTCGRTDEQVPDVLGNRFKETDNESTTPPPLDNETQIPDVNSLIDDLQKSTGALINKTLDMAKAIEKGGEENITGANTLNSSKEDYVGDQQLNPKKIEPPNQHDYSQPEVASGQSKSDFNEEIVEIDPEENVGNAKDAHFRNNPSKSSSILPKKEEVHAGNNPKNMKTESVNWEPEDDRVAPKSSNRNNFPHENVAETEDDATPFFQQRSAEENEAVPNYHPSNVFGKIIPEQDNTDPIDGDVENSKVYFVGTGMQLPLNMKRFDDGSYQLSVDMDKLCTKCVDNACSITSLNENVGPTRNSGSVNSKYPNRLRKLMKRSILPIRERRKTASNTDLENGIDKQLKRSNMNSFDDNFRGSRDVARQRTALVNNVLMWIKDLAAVDTR